jgi:septum formation protein
VVSELVGRGGGLVLASQSPQRRAILEQLGFDFTAVVPDYDEVDPPGVQPAELALAHARGKARSVPGDLVLGVDTVVDLDGRSLGKPDDEQHAGEMLRAMAGRTHLVHSGLCLAAGGGEHVRLVTTRVRFRPLDDADVAWYLGCREWQGRAGAYAVQGRGALLVEHVEGDHWNVVGLPVSALVDALCEALPTAP